MLTHRWLGRIGYEDALSLQEARHEAVLAGGDGELLLLEHDPVYTIGRTPDQSSLQEPESLPHPVVVTNRGGQATYHGPGQLVGYPIVALADYGKDLHAFLRALEDGLIDACEEVGVAAERREGLTGVWVGDKKIASIGVGVRRWVTMHGFAINVSGDLEGFSAIVPCGIDGVTMGALESEGADGLTVRGFSEMAGRRVLARIRALG